ncbi:MAG: hypothetical protein PHE56_11150, partial [Bacteroidales bacterium]|nr:hypothetical protein [Bacteroidales bacterium]
MIILKIKECVIFCFVFLWFVSIGNGQLLTSTAKDLYVLSNNYAQTNWNSNAKIVSIETANVYADGKSESWTYRNNVLGNQGDYLVVGWYNAVSGLPQFTGNLNMSYPGMYYSQLELTILDSDQAISIAEENGGSWIRENYSSVTCFA